MDSTGSLLAGPRAQRAFILRVCMSPPWSVRIEDEAPLTVVMPVRGDMALRFDDGEEATIRQGQVATIKGPDHYVVADQPDSPVVAIIDANEECHSTTGEPLMEAMGLGIATWGNDIAGPHEFITGIYSGSNEIGAPLLAALPRLLVLDSSALEWPLMDLLQRELGHEGPGQDVVLDRMLDLLLMAVLRSWVADQESSAPDWARTCEDPVVRKALGGIHHNPEQPWTVASLAAFTGVSRAVLARRFTEALGDPPMTYLTRWRIQLAADLLLEDSLTLDSIARRVGYATPFGLSSAFKRVKGLSPLEFRRLGPAPHRAATP